MATLKRTTTSPADDAQATGTALPRAGSGLMARIAARYHVDPDKMTGALKATVFRQKDVDISNEQLLMLMVVADQYQLNPFTAEIYAFPSTKGIIPIVSVDGWLRIINTHPQLAGMEFRYSDDGSWCECIIERKDRTRPTVVREYLEECRRETAPWRSHPQRMLRHKTLIQCARVAFGFAGIYDEDEAQRIVDSQAIEGQLAAPRGKPVTEAPRALTQDTVRPTQPPPETAQTVDMQTGEVLEFPPEDEAGVRG